MPDSTAPTPRFIALDVHRQDVMMAAIDVDQHILLPPRRMPFPAFADWAPTHLSSSDQVVLEATTTAWHRSDQWVPLVASVQVANPLLVTAISTAKVKTDARDTLTPSPTTGWKSASHDLDPSQRGPGTVRPLVPSSSSGGVAHAGAPSTASPAPSASPGASSWRALCRSPTGVVAGLS